MTRAELYSKSCYTTLKVTVSWPHECQDPRFQFVFWSFPDFLDIYVAVGPYLFCGCSMEHPPEPADPSAALPFHFHVSGIRVTMMAARHLGACAKAIRDIK
jgi:hypothetical protein